MRMSVYIYKGIKMNVAKVGVISFYISITKYICSKRKQQQQHRSGKIKNDKYKILQNILAFK